MSNELWEVERMKLTLKEKASYGIGALGKDMACGIVNTFLMFYFTDVIGLAPAFLGILFLVARAWDAIDDPLIGWLIDNTKTRLGKFRPWILAGTLFNSIVLIFLFHNPGYGGNGLYIYFSVIYILWGITYSLEDIAYWSMIPALADTESERNTISVIPRVFAALGNVTVGSFGLIAVNAMGKVSPGQLPTPATQQTGFFGLAIIIAVIFIITNITTVVFVKEKVVIKQSKHFKFIEIFTTILKNDQLVIILLTMVTYTLAINITAGLGLYYFKYDIGDASLYGMFYLAAGAAQVLAMILFPAFAKWLTRRKVFIIATILPLFGYAALYLTGRYMGGNIILLSIAGVVLFFGFGFATVLTSVMLADAVDYGEWKLGYRSESIIFSMQTFMVKITMGISGMITGLGLSAFGFIANKPQSTTALTGIRILMFVIPIILMMIALIIYVKNYKLNGHYFTDIKKQLDERRAQL